MIFSFHVYKCSWQNFSTFMLPQASPVLHCYLTYTWTWTWTWCYDVKWHNPTPCLFFVCYAGLVADCPLTNFTPATCAPYTTDNDGLWTSILVAAEAIRYQVTKDASAKQNSWSLFKGMQFLVNVSQHGSGESGQEVRPSLSCVCWEVFSSPNYESCTCKFLLGTHVFWLLSSQRYKRISQ